MTLLLVTWRRTMRAWCFPRIPSAVLAAIAWGARHGILFRGGAAVEKLAGITTVALDKTGTLTTGELRVERVESFPPGREEEVARLAYSIERLSTHPLARAITRYGKQQGLGSLELENFESFTGQGLRARYATIGVPARETRMVEFTDRRPIRPGSTRRGFRSIGDLALVCGELTGRLVALRDDVRPSSQPVSSTNCRREGPQSVVLTGDHS